MISFLLLFIFLCMIPDHILVFFFLLPASRVWQENPKLPAPVTLFFY